MALDVVTQVTIGRPAAEVAAVQFDPANDPLWIGGVFSAELLTEPPLAQGSRVLRKGAFLGRPIEWLMEVVEFEPARRVAMHALRSPFPMDATYELESGGNETVARIRIKGDARGPYGLAGPLLPTMVRRSVSKDLSRLKKLVEDGR